MTRSYLNKLIVWGLVALMVLPASLPATEAAQPLSQRERALHALNRLAFGPRPGDVETVLSVGVEQWIEEQLNAGKIDDSALQARLRLFRTLAMSTEEMLEEYPSPQMVQAAMRGRAPLPSDPKKRAVYETQMEMLRMRRERQARDGQDGDMEGGLSRSQRRQARVQAEALLGMDAEERERALLALSPEERVALARSLGGQRQAMAEMEPEERSSLLALLRPQFVIVSELQEAKLLRAVYSQRQLEEVMTDFWFNHFNVFIGKGPDRYLLTSYERDAIRPHALGKFEDLLLATARHPAMLFYLDNWQSAGPNSMAARFYRGEMPANMNRGRGRFDRRRRQQRMDHLSPQQRQRLQQAAQRFRGLNENYARELMELHTLGVDGGYTQQDVTEVARVFTGWTLERPQQGGSYRFQPRLHEPGDKTVLGKKIREAGEREGIEVLRMLAHHPSTAHFISRKLAQRFVSDQPPQALVERMAEVFLRSDGDIRQVLGSLFHSPEFWSRDNYQAKVKTPLEFVASAVRATRAEVKTALPLAEALRRLEMPLYGAQPPTGYSMQADAWVNSSALLNRMNVALALAGGRLSSSQTDSRGLATASQPQAALRELELQLMGHEVSAQTREAILKQFGGSQLRRGDAHGAVLLTGLLLGSPEFQRR